MMNDLNKVIKTFKSLQKKHKNELAISYYCYIVKALLIEKDYPEQCKACGKVVHHHFMYWLPDHNNMSQKAMDKFFLTIYDVDSPIRFSIETLSSIEEIRLDKRWQ